MLSHQEQKKNIKSVAALLFLFLKPYFIITFFLHSEFSWWYYLLAFLRASPRHFLCCRMMVPDGGVALKKVHFFMIILYQAKQATLLKAMALLQSQVNLKEPVGRIYIFKEGRNERKKDDHNDDMCVCILAKPTAYNSFFFISIYRTVEYFCLVECRRVVYRWDGIYSK